MQLFSIEDVSILAVLAASYTVECCLCGIDKQSSTCVWMSASCWKPFWHDAKMTTASSQGERVLVGGPFPCLMADWQLLPTCGLPAQQHCKHSCPGQWLCSSSKLRLSQRTHPNMQTSTVMDRVENIYPNMQTWYTHIYLYKKYKIYGVNKSCLGPFKS